MNAVSKGSRLGKTELNRLRRITLELFMLKAKVADSEIRVVTTVLTMATLRILVVRAT